MELSTLLLQTIGRSTISDRKILWFLFLQIDLKLRIMLIKHLRTFKVFLLFWDVLQSSLGANLQLSAYRCADDGFYLSWLFMFLLMGN